MNRPWPGEKRENKLSWGVYYYNGIWIWNDSAREESGNAISFVQRYFGLSFTDAINKIAWDFGIGGKQVDKSSIVHWTAPTVQEKKEYAHIAFTHKPWGDEHFKFWENTEVTESHCLKYETYAVKDCAINHRKVKLKLNEVVWAYYCPEEDAVKLYFPEREGMERFRTNVSGTHLWNYRNLVESGRKCNRLFIQKSNKDKLVTLLLTPDVIATQSEKSKIFDKEFHPEIVENINNLSPNPCIFYGSDPDGKKKSNKIVELTGWNSICTPEIYLPEINDIYGFVKKFGLKRAEEFLKYNNYL
jgi:hypothetical protein